MNESKLLRRTRANWGEDHVCAKPRAQHSPTASLQMADEKDANENSEDKEDSAEQDKKEEQPEPESKESKNIRERLRYHAENIQQAISRMEYNRTKRFYFCTVPGLLRLLQFVLALICICTFGYYCTDYEEIDNMIPPYCLATTRELYFMICCYHSLLGSLTIILAGNLSSFSNAALLSSLYPFLFNAFQSFFLFISSISLMQFYRVSADKISDIMPEGSSTKIGISFLGFVLACLHVASAFYDIFLFIHFLRGFRSEQKALLNEQQELLQKS
ncbi:hypothetical protein JTE90_000534 [Oedothorax gibbosus]|uniref:Uncharacterized protein n=1 Tax=Oedothorax gibbosus TaxID=931172 RepID=A0AAV6VVA1_9ARAC|nr:hypothetical protein JTE90_000534 [Oedothorax gibbosus]